MARDIYADVIRGFNRAGIAYVVVGVSGINYYARDVHNLIMTADFDIFLKPDVKNITKAVKLLKDKGFTVASGAGGIQRLNKEKMQDIVKRRLPLTCSNPYGNVIDICLEVSGFTFEEIAGDCMAFKGGTTSVKVGRLKKLLRMKEIAARDKDVLFLKKYRLMLEEQKGRKRGAWK